MSFSFNFRARTVAAALALAAVEMNRVVQQQSVHAADKDAVLGAIKNQLAIIEPAVGSDHVSLSVSGSVGWRGSLGITGANSADFAITGANVNVGAYVIPASTDTTASPVREAPEA